MRTIVKGINARAEEFMRSVIFKLLLAAEHKKAIAELHKVKKAGKLRSIYEAPRNPCEVLGLHKTVH